MREDLLLWMRQNPKYSKSPLLLRAMTPAVQRQEHVAAPTRVPYK